MVEQVDLAVQDQVATAAAAPLIAEVAVDRPGRDCYSWLVPETMDLAVGDCVQVPFRNQLLRGFVLELHRRPCAYRLKAVQDRRSDLRLPSHLLRLIAWGAKYYRCSIGAFLAAAVPAPVREGVEAKVERLLRPDPAFTGSLSAVQAKALAALPAEGVLGAAAAARAAACSPGTIRRLLDLGALQLLAQEVDREFRLAAEPERHPPNDEQALAIAAVAACLDPVRYQVFLLYGITGSGKTLVYQELAEQVLAAGRQVLMLLPEISLTPQLAARLRARFPRVGVWHSGLAQGDRSLLWRRVAAGDIDFVVGTRSALFAPLPAPGLIIVDEEHESSFKQDSTPRYHARDLAVVYGQQLGVPVLLGSATPSLESYRNANERRYTPLSLRHRPVGGSLPTPLLVDMAEEAKACGRGTVLSRALLDGLTAVRAAGEQAIILLNRRGWSPVVHCLDCGEAVMCPSCAIGLTWHRGAELLRCHCCGYQQPMPHRCPSCGGDGLSARGVGTEQLAQLLVDRVPGLRLLRLDADTAGQRQAHARLLDTFARGEADCLVGTQMVAKGLDFPRVTLVGIIGADRSLAIPDFRAAERTWQLVAQVSGRAGRGARPGTVVIQAYDTQAESIHCAVAHRPRRFYDSELALRKTYGYPPWTGLLRILWRGPDAGRVQLVAAAQGARLRELAGDMPVLGPNPAGLPLLQDQWRWHALVKGGSRGLIQQLCDRLEAAGVLRDERGVKVVLDVDPVAMQ